MSAIRDCQSAYEVFTAYGFDSHIASTASTIVYSKGRSKKTQEYKYVQALWYSHNKHGRITTLDEISDIVGAKKKYKIQPEKNKISIKTVRSQLEYYFKTHEGDSVEEMAQCRELADKLDADDGLPSLVQDAALAVIWHVKKKAGTAGKKDCFCAKYKRSASSITNAYNLLQKWLE